MTEQDLGIFRDRENRRGVRDMGWTKGVELRISKLKGPFIYHLTHLKPSEARQVVK